MMRALTSTSRWPYAVSGVVAAAAGMAVGHLVAAVGDPATSPVLAVGSVVVDAAPRALKEWAVSTLGTADKPVLIGSVALVTLVLSAGLGLLARTRRRVAFLGLIVLTGLAGLAAVNSLTRTAAASSAILPSFASGLAGLGVLAFLTHRADAAGGFARETRLPAYPVGTPTDAPRAVAPAHGGRPRPAQTPVDHHARATGEAPSAGRRTFVLGSAGLGAGALVVAALGQVLARPVAAAKAFVLPPVHDPLPALPVGLEATVPGVTPLRTPTTDFYRIDTAFSVPRIDPAEWRLTIDGMVDRDLSMGLAELVSLGLVERDITLNCVSNEVGGGYIGSTRWGGVPVRLLLERAGVQAGADQVLSTSVDGMTISTPVEALLAGGEREALLAVTMGGEPLPRDHGFPVRLVTPGLYGFVGATKWLERLTVTTFAQDKAYWSTRGWAERAEVQIQTRIDTPAHGRTTPAGTVAIGGVAWAQADGGISGVEVQVDDGPWQQARLGPLVGPVYWRQWWLPWEATLGEHRLTARASDAAGVLQSSAVADPAPSGATGWHVVDVTVT